MVSVTYFLKTTKIFLLQQFLNNKYLGRTKNMVLVLDGSNTLRVSGYTDVSFQTDKDNGRS